jgi:hypothetical protein
MLRVRTFDLLLVGFLLGPLEWGGVLVPASDKGFHCLNQHFDAGEGDSCNSLGCNDSMNKRSGCSCSE